LPGERIAVVLTGAWGQPDWTTTVTGERIGRGA
jgi:hypothetical protein